MTICALLLWLIMTALVLTAWALGANRVLAAPSIARAATVLCSRLCRIAIVMALLGGVVLGIWLCRCGPALWRLLQEAERCRVASVLVLLLLVLGLVLLAIAVAACRATGVPTVSRDATGAQRIASLAPSYLLPALLLALFYLVVRCCGLRDIGATLWGNACGRLLGLALLLGLVGLLLYLLHLRHCRKVEDPRACRNVRLFLVLALILTLVAIGLVRRCCDELRHKDYELAMVGIWWDGQYPGESGAHLRWAFRDGLPFPPGGFDLMRRPSAGGAWTTLNGSPIRPADIWNDGLPAPGPMWQRRAVDRLPPSRWAHFDGEPWNEFHDMVGQSPFAPLFFVQAPDDPTAPVPSSPYTTQAALDAYLTVYHSVPDRPPLAQWQLAPMTALQLTALHPDIARLLGLLYIDKTADPNTEYDYRIVGHWADGDRTYTVTRLSRPLTAPLDPTPLTALQTPVVHTLSGGSVTDDRAVALRWQPPVPSPNLSLAAVDGIKPVRYAVRRRDLGPRPCPSSVTPGPDYVPIERAPGEVVEPVAVTPRSDNGVLSWPKWFYTDRAVEYRCYGYALAGVDVFGRESALSNALLADVVDRSGPPPPPNVEATVFQRADAAALAALTAAERDALFPPASSHASALRVSFIWPAEFAANVPDAKEFRLFVKISGYAAFSRPANRALWPQAANWDATPISLPIGAGQPLPARLVAAGVTNAQYYEAIWFEPPIQGNDDTPVGYGWAGVAGVDHSPFNNVGSVGPPVVIFARDLVPPDPPTNPSLEGDPAVTDGGANAELRWSVPADARYLYHFLRTSGRALEALPAPTGTPPACLAPFQPTCPPGDPACDAERRRFELRWKAALHPELFGAAPGAPKTPEPAGPGHRFVASDRVDATVGDDHLYAAVAIDRAGNRSAAGCAGLAMVRDAMPPRAPVVSTALGGEGVVRVAWMANPELDLARYRLFRTIDPALDGSLERMTLIAEFDKSGTATAPAGTPNATVSGAGSAYVTLAWEDRTVSAARDYFYRLVAIDASGNVSKLSSAARARSLDTTPPGPPGWSAPAVTRGSDAAGPFAELHFVAPAGDSTAKLRIQRRATGLAFWMPVSAWLDPGTTHFVDRQAAPDRGYTYRVQAMDSAGNVGNFGTPRSAP